MPIYGIVYLVLFSDIKSLTMLIKMHSKNYVLIQLYVYFTLLSIITCFDNIVSPKCSPDDEICSFEMHIERRRTMTLYGRPKDSIIARDSARYVIIKDGKLYKRENDHCSHLEPLTNEELKKTIIADGGYDFVYTINGQFPGPTIVVYEGQEVAIDVTSHLYQESFTIHWHGLRQIDTNWMDGVPSVTQCAIGPEETFTYRFVADPIGTHWYHSHQGAQRSDGMYGAIIVLPKPRPQTPGGPSIQDNSVHQDYMMMVQDWYPGGSNKIFHTFYNGLAKYEVNGPENTTKCYVPSVQADGTEIGPIPFHSSLINGRGFKDKMISPLLLEEFAVESGKTYRFRIINPGLLYTFRVSIDDHQMSVISSDGDDVNPVKCDGLFLTSGERYDVLVHANHTQGSYWIRVETVHWDKETGTPTPHTVLGILKYSNSDEINPTSVPRNCTHIQPCTYVNCPFKEFPEDQHIKCINIEELTSVEISNLMLKPPTLKQIFLTFQFSRSTDGGTRSSINGIQHLTATKSTKPGDTTFVKDCVHTDCASGPCRCTNVLQIPIGTTVQMVFTSQMIMTEAGTLGADHPGSSHPVHMHGHHFYVLKMGYPKYDKVSKQFEAMNPDIYCPTTRCNNASWSIPDYNNGVIPGLNLINPPKKDTIHVPAGGYAVVRFEADNPGFWMLHCHIENHNLEGMALVMQEGNVSEINPPPEHFPVCGTFKLSHEDYKNAIQRPLKIDPLYSVWIPALIIIMVISNFIVAAITWKMARKDIMDLDKTSKKGQDSLDTTLNGKINEREEMTPLL